MKNEHQYQKTIKKEEHQIKQIINIMNNFNTYGEQHYKFFHNNYKIDS